MSDFESPTSAASNGGLRFSTWGLMVLLTIVSLVLATFVGVIRSFAISSKDVLFSLDVWLRYQLPEAVVALSGLCFALISQRLNRRARRLSILAFSGIALLQAIEALAEIVAISSTDFTLGLPTWYNCIIAFYLVLRPILWGLVVVALFYGRNDNATHQSTSSVAP